MIYLRQNTAQDVKVNMNTDSRIVLMWIADKRGEEGVKFQCVPQAGASSEIKCVCGLF